MGSKLGLSWKCRSVGKNWHFDSLLTHEHNSLLHFLRSFLVSLSNVYLFKHVVLSYLLLDLSSHISYFYAYCSYISLFDCFLIQYENKIYFSIFILFFINLPNSPFIFSSFFFFNFIIFSTKTLCSLKKKKKDSFTSSFPKRVLFIHFLAIL